MRTFPHTPEFLRIARRVVWFKSPDEALRNPAEFVAYALKHSTDEDMGLIISHIGLDGIREALDNAPPGVIDARSWSYWNSRVGRYPAPPMPTRSFDHDRD